MTDLADPTTEPVVHLTTGQLQRIHDNKMRAAAKAAGHPTDRTYAAGMILAGSLGQVAFTGGDGKVYLLPLDDADASPTQMRYADLRALVADAYDLGDPRVNQYRATVIADRVTLNRMARMAETHAEGDSTPEARRLARLFTYRRGLPVSVCTPVLTDALAFRYWLPAGLDPKALADWSEAFGMSGQPTSRHVLNRLIALAMDGGTDGDIVKTLTDGELWGTRSAQYASLSSACSAYGRATTVSDAFSALTALDPLLRERNAIDGTVSQVRILQIDSTGIRATVSDPFRLREGAKVYLFDGHPSLDRCELTLRNVDFKDGQLLVTFSKGNSKTKNRHLVEEAKKNYTPLYAAAAPFLMVKKAPKNARWVQGQESGEDRTLHVDIPVDIALAGAPTSDD